MSGTETEHRPELQRLVADCREQKIDLILTKSISHFSRSTSDCLGLIRMLQGMGVHIWFEKENIHTGTMESELMLSVLSCMAEDESRSLSANLKWGIRKRFENGTYRQARTPYGYQWKEDEMVIVPEQAAIVQEIFSMVLSGRGGNVIARELNRRQITSPGGKQWNQKTVRNIVRNPAYIGATLYQKPYRDEAFRQKRNNGILDRYYNPCHHEAIVSRTDFIRAQRAVNQRGKEVGYRKGKAAGRSQHRYGFSGKLICAECGAAMHRQAWGSTEAVWICYRHAREPESCKMKPQSETDLKNAFINCLNKLSWSQRRKDERRRVLDVYEKKQMEHLSERYAGELERLEEQLQRKQQEERSLATMMRKSGVCTSQHNRKKLLIKELHGLESERRQILKEFRLPEPFFR